MLINPNNSALLVIDIQEKLLPALHNQKNFLNNCRWLIEIAQALSIPTLATEQYPKGLGHTEPSIASLIQPNHILYKEHFSTAEDPECLKTINALNVEQLILIGSEAHICVLQSALGLAEQGFDVFVVADAIGSRKEQDLTLALTRFQQNGIQVVSREMVAYEWLYKSNTEQFRAISKAYLRD